MSAGIDDSLVELDSLRGRAVLETRGAQVCVCARVRVRTRACANACVCVCERARAQGRELCLHVGSTSSACIYTRADLTGKRSAKRCSLYGCVLCMPYMYAVYVCLMCMPYMTPGENSAQRNAQRSHVPDALVLRLESHVFRHCVRACVGVHVHVWVVGMGMV